MQSLITDTRLDKVAPYTGAWIEIKFGADKHKDHGGRSLHGSVD
ncbi:hypothetical protein [Caproicibacterium sp. XB2]